MRWEGEENWCADGKEGSSESESRERSGESESKAESCGNEGRK